MRTTRTGCAILLTALWSCGTADQPTDTHQTTLTGTSAPSGGSRPAKTPEPEPTNGWSAVPLAAAVSNGLLWLAAGQSDDGGYGQDGAKPRDGINQESNGTDVANTAIAALAFVRAGTKLQGGPHAEHLRAALEYVLRAVETAPEEGLAITTKQGTQIQRKLGPHVDTFLAAMLLTELKGKMVDEQAERRLVAAIDKCVDKIEKNQQKDGSWNSGGWAPIINTSMASRSLFLAKTKGITVDETVLERVDTYTRGQFDAKKRSFAFGDGDAGVGLYKVAQALEQGSRAPADNAPMLDAASDLLRSEAFTAGFGSMGGEEFISYMNVSDSLLREGGDRWEEWNGQMKERLGKLQNQDGSWAGHHCITGRVACTSAAILTMVTERTVDRPVAIGDGK